MGKPEISETNGKIQLFFFLQFEKYGNSNVLMKIQKNPPKISLNQLKGGDDDRQR